jgi:hypothetical protein
MDDGMMVMELMDDDQRSMECPLFLANHRGSNSVSFFALQLFPPFSSTLPEIKPKINSPTSSPIVTLDLISFATAGE